MVRIRGNASEWTARIRLADARLFVFALPERQLGGPHLKLAIQLLDESSRDRTMVAEAEARIQVAGGRGAALGEGPAPALWRKETSWS